VSAIEAMSLPGSVQTVLGAGYIGGLRRYGVNRVLVRPIPLSHLMNGKAIYIGAQLPKID